jgi:hypothetical protein
MNASGRVNGYCNYTQRPTHRTISAAPGPTENWLPHGGDFVPHLLAAVALWDDLSETEKRSWQRRAEQARLPVRQTFLGYNIYRALRGKEMSRTSPNP